MVKKLLLGGKWCVALLLVFATTLPFTTCKGQPSYIQWKIDNLWTIFCFVWPFPLLIVRTIWREVRGSWPVALFEMLLAIAAWLSLSAQFMAFTAISFGGIHAGDGFDLAIDALIGYFVLSLAELVTNVRSGRRRRSLQSMHAAIDQVPEPRA